MQTAKNNNNNNKKKSKRERCGFENCDNKVVGYFHTENINFCKVHSDDLDFRLAYPTTLRVIPGVGVLMLYEQALKAEDDNNNDQELSPDPVTRDTLEDIIKAGKIIESNGYKKPNGFVKEKADRGNLCTGF